MRPSSDQTLASGSDTSSHQRVSASDCFSSGEPPVLVFPSRAASFFRHSAASADLPTRSYAAMTSAIAPAGRPEVSLLRFEFVLSPRCPFCRLIALTQQGFGFFVHQGNENGGCVVGEGEFIAEREQQDAFFDRLQIGLRLVVSTELMPGHAAKQPRDISHLFAFRVVLHDRCEVLFGPCVPKENNHEFAWRMEDVLSIYELPYDQRFPVVCMDEASKQLIGEVACPTRLEIGNAKQLAERRPFASSTSILHCFQQPDFGISPVSGGSTRRNIKCFRSLIHRQPCEIPKRHQAGNLRSLLGEFGQRFIQRDDTGITLPIKDRLSIQRNPCAIATSFERPLLPRVFDQNPPHGFRCCRIKMPPMRPTLLILLIDKPHIRLMNKSRWL